MAVTKDGATGPGRPRLYNSRAEKQMEYRRRKQKEAEHRKRLDVLAGEIIKAARKRYETGALFGHLGGDQFNDVEVLENVLAFIQGDTAAATWAKPGNIFEEL